MDKGSLRIDRSGSVTLNNISGTGQVVLIGSGTTTLGTGNTYSGRTLVQGGTLAVGDSATPGSGTLLIFNGELLATATETISWANIVQLGSGVQFGSTLAAAHGQTLPFNPVHLHFCSGGRNF